MQGSSRDARDRREHAADERIGELDAGAGGDADGDVDGAEPTSCSSRCGVEKTPGRNEPCYCGSGKKYKLCHGR